MFVSLAHVSAGRTSSATHFKLAMIKNQHLAQKLFGGKVYDCVCLFEPASAT